MSRQIRLPTHALILIGVALISSGAARALSSDNSKPMHIEADEVTIDDRKQVSVYHGDVVVTQGTLRVTADKLSVYMKDGDIDKIIAVGKPATYKQRPEGREQDVEAEALSMEYRALESTVILNDRAKLWQGPNTFASERIIYNVAQDQVKAGEEVGGDRVRITIHPEKANH